MENYEIIVLDLDGTLTNRDKVITPKTKKALMEIQERGKKIVLASGRPTDGVMPLARELKLEKYGSYILSFNGGMITNCRTGEAEFSRLQPSSAGGSECKDYRAGRGRAGDHTHLRRPHSHNK